MCYRSSTHQPDAQHAGIASNGNDSLCASLQRPAHVCKQQQDARRTVSSKVSVKQRRLGHICAALTLDAPQQQQGLEQLAPQLHAPWWACSFITLHIGMFHWCWNSHPAFTPCAERSSLGSSIESDVDQLIGTEDLDKALQCVSKAHLLTVFRSYACRAMMGILSYTCCIIFSRAISEVQGRRVASAAGRTQPCKHRQLGFKLQFQKPLCRLTAMHINLVGHVCVLTECGDVTNSPDGESHGIGSCRCTSVVASTEVAGFLYR